MEVKRKLNSPPPYSGVYFDTRLQCQKLLLLQLLLIHPPAIKNDEFQTFIFLHPKSAVRIAMKTP